MKNFGEMYEKREKEKSSAETTAENLLVIMESFTPYTEGEHRIYTDLQESLKEIIIALQAKSTEDTAVALRCTERIMRKHGAIFNINKLHEQVQKEIGARGNDTDYLESIVRHRAETIADEQEDLYRYLNEEMDAADMPIDQETIRGSQPAYLTALIQKLGKTKIAAHLMAAATALMITGCAVRGPGMDNLSRQEVASMTEADRYNEYLEHLKDADPDAWYDFLNTETALTDSTTDALLTMWETFTSEQRVHILFKIYSEDFHTIRYHQYDLLVSIIKVFSEEEDSLRTILKNAPQNVRGACMLLRQEDFLDILISIDTAELEKLLKLRIQEATYHAGEKEELRYGVEAIIKKTRITDDEALSLHQQIDQKYPDPPPEELFTELKEPEKAEKFFSDESRDLLHDDSINPKTIIALLDTLLKYEKSKELLYDLPTEIETTLKKFYFYPEAKELARALLREEAEFFIDVMWAQSGILPLAPVIQEEVTRIPNSMYFKKAFEIKVMLDNYGLYDFFWEEIKKRTAGIAPLVLEKQHIVFDRRNISGFLQDPALSLVENTNFRWVPEEHLNNLSVFHKAAHRLMILRNLYFQGVRESDTITKEMVVSASDTIIEKREEMRNIKLIEDRQVIVVAGNEHGPDWRTMANDDGGFFNIEESEYGMPISKEGRTMRLNEDEYRFGKDTVVEEIRRQNAASCKRFRAEKEDVLHPDITESQIDTIQERVGEMKQRTLDAIAQTTGEMTVIFDAHGLEDGIYLIGGYSDAVPDDEEWKRITPQDIADSLAERHDLQKEKVANGEMTEAEAQQPAIIIFAACYSHNQMRKVYEAMRSDVDKPIIVVIAEYDQFGYSSLYSPFGSDYLEANILQTFPYQKGLADMEKLIKEVQKKHPFYNDSKVGVFIIDGNNRPIQISEATTDEPPEQSA